ncbi:hypothetical protein SDJN03_12970, partial [Cucurbita argyrosperma subsp. sororia]
MGKATRWLKGLLGIKKDKDPSGNSDSKPTPVVSDRKEKKRWSFAKSGRDSGQTPPRTVAVDSAWFSSYISDSEKEQNKHAIAVAAATAAAADAAVAAAQAAVAVVRLTSQRRGPLYTTGRDRWAAVKIQTVFKGYLVKNRFIPEIRPRKSAERFDETRSEFHSKRLSIASSYETSINSLDESPKIVEIDTYRTRSKSRRYISTLSEYGGDEAAPLQAITSPLPYSNRPRTFTLDCHNVHRDFEWCLMGEDCKFPTAHSTPRLSNSFASTNMSVTPSKSVCGDSFFRPYMNCPSYMANTQSFKAKLRSQSAPKQRPEPGSKKKLSLNEIMAARNSLSSVRMQRPSNQTLQEHEEHEEHDEDEDETSYDF